MILSPHIIAVSLLCPHGDTDEGHIAWNLPLSLSNVTMFLSYRDILHYEEGTLDLFSEN